MMMKGKPPYESIIGWAKKEVTALKKNGINPTLAAILTGSDEISRVYVNLKGKDCQACGIKSEVYEAYKNEGKDTYGSDVIKLIKKLNQREDIHGILVQLPVSPKVNQIKVFDALDPKKDVDCLTPHNLGKLMKGEYEKTSMLPCTPKGIIRLLDYYKIPIEGQDVSIIGRSFLVGDPLRKILQDRSATVTCLHSKTKNIREKIKNSDIIIPAVGRPPEIYDNGFRLTGDMIKDGAVVVGVGVRKKKDKLYFDVDVESISAKASFVTPNIGGVGIMTRACLIENTVNSAKMLSNV